MEYIRRLFLYQKGFSLAELVIYLGILGLSVGVFTSVLDTVTKTQVEQSTQNEISGQLTFSMQTIQRLIKTSSVIDLEAGVATSTLVLQMPQQALSPTTVYLENGTIYITQGEDAPVQALTSGSVTVDSLEFRKSSQPGAKDVVQIDIAISQFEPSQGDLVTRSLRSAVSRVSAVTFDSHLLPPTDGQYDVGSATLRWRDGYFSGKISPGEICLGGDCKSSWGAITGVSGSGSSNYLAKWQTSGTITSSIIVDDGTNVGIGVLNPSAKFHVNKGSSGIVANFTADSGNYLYLGNDTNGQWIEARGADTAHRKLRIQVFDGTSYYQQLYIDGANQRMYVPSGVVGIGTASPDTNYKLTLAGGGIKSENTSAQPAGYFSSTGGGKAIQTGSGSILFGSLAGSGTRTLVVDSTGLVSATTTSSGDISGTGVSGYIPIWSGASSLATSTIYETGGKVGIGTTNPQVKLDTGGTIRITGQSSNPVSGSGIEIFNNSSGGYVQTFDRTAGLFKKTIIQGSPINFGSGSGADDPWMTILNSGYVGIGTTGPTDKLHIDGTDTGLIIEGDANWGIGSQYIKFARGSGITWTVGQDDDSTNNFYFARSDGFGAPKVTISDNGNVGIGTASPAYKLDVTGDARFTQPIVVGTPTLDTHATTKSYVDSAVSSGVGSGVSGTTNYIAKFTSSNVVGNSGIYESSGNIGIGTTTPSSKLHVAGTGLAEISIGANITNESRLGFRGSDGSYNQFRYSWPNNRFEWWEESSNLMVLTSSGNLGVGVSSPTSKLEVGGTVSSGAITTSGVLTVNNDRILINRSSDYGAYLRLDRNSVQGWVIHGGIGIADDRFSVRNASNYDALTIKQTGEVGVGNTLPSYKLDVSGTGRFTQPVIVGTPTATDHAATKSYVDSAITTGTGNYVLKAGDTMTGTLAFASGSADRLNLNGNNIVGVNKLTVTTIDPIYEINNKKYATYVSDTIGLKMEHYGKVTTAKKEKDGYSHTIDFSKETEGSDLWLFWQTIDEGVNMQDIILTMTPESNTNTWYSIVPEKNQIQIFSSSPTTLSYHLVAPRHDSDTWGTHLPQGHKEPGTVLQEKE